MEVIITISDDQVPGRCITATNGSDCPFGRHGCWVRDPKNCPLNTARPLKTSEATLAKVKETLRDISVNFDHDGDAHKYGTPCRACEAQKALDLLNARPLNGPKP